MGPSIKHALAAIARAEAANASSLPFDDVPPEILCSQHLNLRAWSMLFSDRTAHLIAGISRDREHRRVEEKWHLFKRLIPGCPETNDEDDDSDSAILDADRKRRVARREAFMDQIRNAEADARHQALRVAQDELGVREVLIAGAYKLTDSGVIKLVSACPNLTAFDISGATRLTDVSLRAIATNCSRLQRLDISGCVGLNGPGLAALGEKCKNLESVRLAGCSGAATGWALAALLKGCGNSLNMLDVSRCMLLNDGDCNSIAKYCPSLTSLSVADARQVSDVGIVAISNRCNCLETLKLSRSEMPHRLTDVALLSMAEGCGKTLRLLDLRGCEDVTDVGLAWVAHQAGATLTSINLRGCKRVGNAGCRAIADHCQSLVRIDLRGARCVSDVGVRVLGASLGSVLEFFDCSFLHLLTDGSDRGFGFEGLLALARDISALTALHLDGCFQVSTRVLTALSKARVEFRELGLAGCPRLTVEGLGSLAGANSHTLEKLNLASCGDCISDAAVVAIARGAPRLRQLVLRDCERWGQVGARAIAQNCRWLERLDCTGCRSISDDAIAFIADTEFEEPGLRHLLLAHCPKFGDIGLAWLVEGSGGANLVTLALLRTCCTTAALKSYRDHFVHSELRRDPDFFGFKARPRWEHRECIHHHAKKRNAAVTFQSAYRALCDRRKFMEVQRHQLLNSAATKTQTVIRRALAQKRVAAIRERRANEWAAAIAIQCLARRAFAYQCAGDHRAAVFRRIAALAATAIQKAWRGLVSRRYLSRLHEQMRERSRMRARSATFLQRHFRGYLGRQQAAMRWRERAAERARQVAAASGLQCQVRAFAAKKHASRIRAVKLKQSETERKAAVLVQSRVRRNRTSAIVQSRRALFQAREHAATSLQSTWRARRDRLMVYVAAAERRHETENESAATIQRAERVRSARLELAARRAATRNELRNMIGAAITLQKSARRLSGQAKAERLRKARKSMDLKLSQIRDWAATTIAAGWRGACGRKEARRALNAKRALWKEMFDEDSQRPFFYNQLTGEIRWRRPQALLDLMKRPICSNCEYFEAATECATCQEFFCADCWQQVHYGGMRAAHPFRSLYDAYGKRVDYGDGDMQFRSHWPSEIIQDDINGILLRIAPHREPVEVIGAWQRYEDVDYGTSFYYNPISGEGTYQPPQVAREMRALSSYQSARNSSTSEYTPSLSFKPEQASSSLSFDDASTTRYLPATHNTSLSLATISR